MSNGYEYILSNYKKPPGYIGESCSRIVAQWETWVKELAFYKIGLDAFMYNPSVMDPDA